MENRNFTRSHNYDNARAHVAPAISSRWLLQMFMVMVAGMLCLFSGKAAAQQLVQPAPGKILPAPKSVSGYVPGRIMVKFKDGFTPSFTRGKSYVQANISELDNLNRTFGCTAANRVFTGRKTSLYLYTFDFPATTNVEQLVKAYQASGVFADVTPDYLVGNYTTTPNDPEFYKSWGLYNSGLYSFNSVASIAGRDIDAKLAWDLTQGSSSVVVAVIDAGMKLDHPEFSGRIWTNSGEIAGNGIDDDNNGYIDDYQGWDWVNNDNNPTDDNGHGTNVAGIIGANGNNSDGYAGVDWHCKLMCLKTQGSTGSGSTSSIIAAVYYATSEGAKVINMSLGGTSSVSSFQDAINYAYSNNVTVVAAMGNDNTSTPSYPAAYNHVIAVGATRCDDHRASFSNYGSHISVVAPGEAIFGLSYLSNTDYTGGMSGTSQATPHVAGLVALMLALDASKTPDQIKAIIEATAEDMVGVSTEDVAGFDNYYGHGRINAYQALLYCTAPNAITGTTTFCVGASSTLSSTTTGGTWTSSATSTATVNSSGVVTGIAAGVATITYQKLLCYRTTTVTIKPTPTSLSVSPSSSSICLGSGAPVTASATAGSVTLLSQDWNSGLLNGWGITSNNTTGAVQWQIRSSPGYGSLAAGDGSAYIEAAPDASSANTTTILTSPAFSTSGYTSATLTYNQFFTSYAAGDVTAAVQYSIDGGSTWTTLVNQLGTSATTSTWSSGTPQITVALPAAALGVTSVKLRWNYNSTFGYYWAVDNIAVKGSGALTYAWTGIGGATGISCASCSSTTLTPTASGSNVYSVTATASSCSASSGTTVTTIQSPAAIGGTATLCTSGTTTLTNTVSGGTWTSGATGVATVNSSGVVTGVASGTAVISYANSCATVTKTVTVNSAPATIGGTGAACVGGTTTLTNTVSGGTWTTSNASIATVGSSTGVVSGVASGNAIITYTTTCGTTTKTVTINSTPAAIGGTATVCVSATTTLTDATSGGTWSSGATGTATVGSTTGVVTGVATGTATISYITTCGTVTKIVTVNAAATAGTISGSSSLCVGSTTSLTSTVSGGTWSSSATATAVIGSSTGVVTAIAGGTTTITYTVTTSCGTATATRIETANPLPGSITGSLTLCNGATSTLSTTSSGGTWSSSNTAIATIGSSNGVVTGVGTGNATITYTLSTGCFTTAVFTVNAVPATITGVSSMCAGNCTTLGDATSGGVWSSSITSVATVGSSSGVVCGTNAGTATIAYTLSTGCTRSTTVTVNPVATINGTATVCESSTTTLTSTVSGGVWNSSNTSVATINTSTGVVAGVLGGTSSIGYTTPAGCVSTRVVTVNSLPSAGTISGTSSLVISGTSTLTSTVSGGTWSSSATAVATVGSSTGVVTGGTTGIATITYTVTTSCGTDAATYTVTVSSVVAASGLNFDGSDDYVNTSSSITNLNKADFTIEAWLKTTGTTSMGIVGCQDADNVWEVGEKSFYIDGSGKPAFVGWGNEYIYSTLAVNDGAWHHVAVTWDYASGTTGVGRIYIDGIDRTGTVSYWANNDNAGTFTIGRPNNNESASNFNGSMDEVRIWNRALCLSEINNNMSCQLTGTETGLQAYYQFNQGSIGVSNAGVTSLTDATGNGNTGTLTNFALTGSTSNWVAGNVSGSCSAFSLITGTASVCEGATTTLASATSGGTWSSSSTATATVDASAGVVSGVAAGTTAISYSTGYCSGGVTATVNAAPSAGTISGSSTICLSGTGTLSSTVSGGAWSSSDPSAVTVNASTGVVTGVSTSSAIISYSVTNSCGTAVATTVVSVIGAPSAGTISGTLTVCAGSTTALSSTMSGGSWFSANTSVATIDGSGTVSGVAAGTATISYAVFGTCGTSYATVVATVNSAPSTATITGSSTVCPGSSTAFTASIAGGSWNSSDPSVVTVTSTGLVTGVVAGSAMISYTLTNSCGSTTATKFISVNSSADAGTLSGSFGVCQGSAITWTSTVSGGVWTSATPSVATVGSATGVITGVSGGSVVISYTVTNGCGTATATTVIDVTPLPTVAAITGSGAICAGSSVTLSDATSGGEWSSSNPSVAPVLGSGQVQGMAAGTATISYTVTGMFGCGYATATKVVTVTALPDAGTISGPTTVTQGSAITLTTSGSGGSFSGSNSHATVSAAGVVSGLSAGTVNVTYTVTNSCGTSTATYAVTVNALVPAITGTLSMCVGGSSTLSNSLSGGTWSSNNTAIATVDASGVVTGIATGNATITYAASGGSATAVVTVSNTPSITGTMTICAGATTTLNNTGSGSGTWTSSDITVATVGSSNGLVTGMAQGTAAITFTLGTGCSASVVITVNGMPAAITGTASACAGSTAALSNATPGGAWSSSNTSVASVDGSGNVTANASGTTTIAYTTGAGCSTSITFTTNALPAIITGANAVCAGSGTLLSSTTLGGAWSSSDNTVATIGTSGAYTGVAAGSATITYTLSTGCSRTMDITVNEVPVISGSLSVCPGTTTALSSSVSGGTWTGGNASIATISSGGVVTAIAAGNAGVTYTVAGSCSASAVVTVTSAPATITGTTKACPGTTTALSSATSGGTWSSADITTATVDASTGVVTGVAAGTVTISYATGAGCARTTIVTINAAPAAIGGTLSTCVGSTTSLTDVTSGFSWGSSNTAIATIASNGTVSGVSTGTATITYTAAVTMCIATADVTINGIPAAIGGPSTGCTGSVITLTDAVPGGAWSSANTAVATVNPATGAVTGVTTGIVAISYSTGAGCYKTKNVTINVGPNVTGYPVVCIGSTTTLSGGSSGTWSSADPTIASIATSGGYTTGMAAGTTTVTFTSTSTGCAAPYTVTVIATPSAITGPTVGCQGSTATLSNTTPGGSWTSSNTAIASVGSATGVVTTVGSGGTATISYSFGSCRVTAPFSAKPIPAAFGGTTSVCMPLTASITTTTGAGTWSSSDVSVATIGSSGSAGNGVMTGVSSGTTNITYTITATGCSRSTQVTVNAGLNPGTLTSSTGAFTLHTVSAPTSLTLSSSGAAGGTWTSSNSSVATVNSSTGLVAAAAAGSTTITYSVTGACTNIVTRAISVTAGRDGNSISSGTNGLFLYPNPTTGAFSLNADEAGVMTVYTIDGKQVYSFDVATGITDHTLQPGLAAGIYMCRFTAQSGSTTIVRLVYEP